MPTTTMRAARVHTPNADMVVETVDAPPVRPDEVLVRVGACSIVQNLANILAGGGEKAGLSSPRLPAIFGLDVAGTIEAVGELVAGVAVGDRVYVNPGIGCGGCRMCRSGREIDCAAYVLRGYFGMSDKGQRTLDAHPYGGLAELMPAPQRTLVRIPDNLDFARASRLGYLGTSFRALKLAGCGAGKVVYIDGITGTLGLGAVAHALALGAERILGAARDVDLFEKVRALAQPGRIEILESGTRGVPEWTQDVTGGRGVDIVIDALGGGAPADPLLSALHSLNRGGTFVNIGAMSEDVPIDLVWAMTNNITILNSSWFMTAEGQEMADMVATGQLDLSFFENETYPLDQVNEAIAATDSKRGGFANYAVVPA